MFCYMMLVLQLATDNTSAICVYRYHLQFCSALRLDRKKMANRDRQGARILTRKYLLKIHIQAP